jgi:hypothetical protein
MAAGGMAGQPPEDMMPADGMTTGVSSFFTKFPIKSGHGESEANVSP